MGFCAAQLDRVGLLWKRMLEHPFLLRTRDGTLPQRTFATWMRQDHLFVEAAIPFMGGLLARAPRAHREPLTEAIVALHRELALFRERAMEAGVSLDDVEPSFTCHAYIQFLLATAARAGYGEAFTVLYVAEKAYHESWKVVAEGIDPDSRWIPFVENWAGESFGEYVAYLEGELDRLAAGAGPATLERMARSFELTVRYEIAFWEMALSGEGWPGLGATHSVAGEEGGERGSPGGTGVPGEASA